MFIFVGEVTDGPGPGNDPLVRPLFVEGGGIGRVGPLKCPGKVPLVLKQSAVQVVLQIPGPGNFTPKNWLAHASYRGFPYVAKSVAIP